MNIIKSGIKPIKPKGGETFKIDLAWADSLELLITQH